MCSLFDHPQTHIGLCIVEVSLESRLGKLCSWRRCLHGILETPLKVSNQPVLAKGSTPINAQLVELRFASCTGSTMLP
jgi:hypothetical protein